MMGSRDPHSAERVFLNGMTLTKAERRRMAQLGEMVDRVTQADRRFFERFPDRTHRLRLASPAEIEQYDIIEGKAWMPPGFRMYVAVKKIASDARMRSFVRGLADWETDVPEATARAVWEAVSNPHRDMIEAKLQKASADRGQR
jgi:hypothetical protein